MSHFNQVQFWLDQNREKQLESSFRIDAKIVSHLLRHGYATFEFESETDGDGSLCHRSDLDHGLTYGGGVALMDVLLDGQLQRNLSHMLQACRSSQYLSLTSKEEIQQYSALSHDLDWS